MWTHLRRIASIKVGRNLVRYRAADIERLVHAGERPAVSPMNSDPPPEAA